MHAEYDPEADALYIRLRNVPYAFGVNLDHARRIDYGEDRLPIGIELLNVRRKGVNLDDVPERAFVESVLRQYDVPIFA